MLTINEIPFFQISKKSAQVNFDGVSKYFKKEVFTP